jgi:Lrp/AsnC family transcriptional regulator, leucine-responsive regulatory protein
MMIRENAANVLAKWGCDNLAFRVFLRVKAKKRWKFARMELDSIDLAILSALQADGRMSNAALAEKVGLSPSACSRRLDNLEKSGTIRGYHARVSNKALGYTMTVIVHISLSGQFQKTLREFEEAIKRCPNVLVCYLMSGEYDYILRIAAKDLADYERIHRDWLSSLPHVVKINSSFALREIIDRPNVGIDPALV